MAKTSCKKGEYYCNTDKKCKPIPEGYTVREDGFLVKEGWSAKYKKSIDCNNPKGFSQKAHCAGRKKRGIEEDNPKKQNTVTNNALFIGSTSELSKMLKDGLLNNNSSE